MTQTRTLRFNANRERGETMSRNLTRLNDFKYERELRIHKADKNTNIEVNAVYCNFDDSYGMRQLNICVLTRFSVMFGIIFQMFSSVKNISDVLYEFENQA